jgi:excinuclease UvrABC nuclease subunit
MEMTIDDVQRLGFIPGGSLISPTSPGGRLDNPYKHLLPHSPGVYAWVINGVVVYLGCAWKKLYRRLVYEHMRPEPQPPQRFHVEARHEMRNALARGEPVQIYFHPCPDEASTRALEKQLIDIHRPAWNTAGTARKRRVGGNGRAARKNA